MADRDTDATAVYTVWELLQQKTELAGCFHDPHLDVGIFAARSEAAALRYIRDNSFDRLLSFLREGESATLRLALLEAPRAGRLEGARQTTPSDDTLQDPSAQAAALEAALGLRDMARAQDSLLEATESAATRQGKQRSGCGQRRTRTPPTPRVDPRGEGPPRARPRTASSTSASHDGGGSADESADEPSRHSASDAADPLADHIPDSVADDPGADLAATPGSETAAGKSKRSADGRPGEMDGGRSRGYGDQSHPQPHGTATSDVEGARRLQAKRKATGQPRGEHSKTRKTQAAATKATLPQAEPHRMRRPSRTRGPGGDDKVQREAEAWMQVKLKAASPDVRRKCSPRKQARMIEYAMDVAGPEVVGRWYDIIDMWRRDPRLVTDAYYGGTTSRPTSSHSRRGGAQLGASAADGARPSHRIKPAVERFIQAYHGVQLDDIKELLQPVLQPYRLAELHRRYVVVKELVDDWYGARPAQVARDAKLELFEAFYPGWKGTTHPLKQSTESASAWNKFGNQLAYGQRMHQLQTELGLGIFTLLPRKSRTFLTNTLSQDDLPIWVDMVRERNLRYRALAARATTLFERVLRGRSLSDSNDRRFAIELIPRVDAIATPDPAPLLEMSDPTALSDVGNATPTAESTPQEHNTPPPQPSGEGGPIMRLAPVDFPFQPFQPFQMFPSSRSSYGWDPSVEWLGDDAAMQAVAGVPEVLEG